jgi:hypothetical protein
MTARINRILGPALDKLYAAILTKIGPQTRVLVIGYPMLIPDPSINTLPNCWYMNHDDKVAARKVIGRSTPRSKQPSSTPTRR